MFRASLRWLLPLGIALVVGAVWLTMGMHAAGPTKPAMVVPPASPGDRLALILTGEGQRPSPAVQDLVLGLAHGGIPTVAMPVTPDDITPARAGARVDSVLRALMSRWHRGRIVLVGYHDGASLAPFVANRIGADLLARVDLLVLAGLEPRANFHAGAARWLERAPRPTDLPVIPELERLRGVPVLCVDPDRGRREGFCATVGQGLVRTRVRLKRAEVAAQGVAVARSVLASLPSLATTP